MSSSLNEKVDNEQNATATESNIGTSNSNKDKDKDKQMDQQQKDQPKDSEPELAKAELCKNNCGFYGNPKTRGLCSTCYTKELKNEIPQQQMSLAAAMSSVISTSPEKPKGGTKRSIYEATYFDQMSNNNNNNNISINITNTPTINDTLSSSPSSSSFSSSSLTPTKQMSQMSTKDTMGGGSSSALLTPTKSAPIAIPNASPSSPQTLNNSPSVSSPVGSPYGKESAKCANESCGKRLGIMSESNKCRCGGTYCGKHMHNHECQFDYKSMAKSNIAKANPQIMANKIVKL